MRAAFLHWRLRQAQVSLTCGLLVRLSASRKSALYAAVSDPIFALRLTVAQEEQVERKQLDRELYALKQEIVRAVWLALGIEGDPPTD